MVGAVAHLLCRWFSQTQQHTQYLGSLPEARYCNVPKTWRHSWCPCLWPGDQGLERAMCLCSHSSERYGKM